MPTVAALGQDAVQLGAMHLLVIATDALLLLAAIGWAVSAAHVVMAPAQVAALAVVLPALVAILMAAAAVAAATVLAVLVAQFAVIVRPILVVMAHVAVVAVAPAQQQIYQFSLLFNETEWEHPHAKGVG